APVEALLCRTIKRKLFTVFLKQLIEDNRERNAASGPSGSEPTAADGQVEDVGLEAGGVTGSLTHSHMVTAKEIVLVVFHFIQDRVAGAADSAETPRRPSPQTPPPAPPGGAQGVPRPAERHSPSSVSWAVPWASSRWDVPGTPPEEGVQESSGIDA
ncbi:hypothetical protein ATANTOWER_031797, partial [Ataeniobius toweri]|nr:hypothetical protein [Ataeniobius toweri]